MSAIEHLAKEILALIEHDPALRAKLFAMVAHDRAPALPANDGDALRTMAIDEYAVSRRMSRRQVDKWIREGMPSIGVGRGKRVDEERADAWVRARSGDASEAEARELARSSLRKVAGR